MNLSHGTCWILPYCKNFVMPFLLLLQRKPKKREVAVAFPIATPLGWHFAFLLLLRASHPFTSSHFLGTGFNPVVVIACKTSRHMLLLHIAIVSRRFLQQVCCFVVVVVVWAFCFFMWPQNKTLSMYKCYESLSTIWVTQGLLTVKALHWKRKNSYISHFGVCNEASLKYSVKFFPPFWPFSAIMVCCSCASCVTECCMLFYFIPP